MTESPAEHAETPVSEGHAGDHGDAPTGSLADRRWRELLELDSRLHEDKGLRLLTPEARVLFYLSMAGPVSVTEVMQFAGTSYRGFYTVLERLKQAGLVASVKDVHDQRVRRLKLEPSAKISSAGR